MLRLRTLLKKVGLPGIRFHDLRHTFATLLIEEGVPVRVMSELLGHSSVNITMQIYSHVTPKMQDMASQTIATWFIADQLEG